MRIHFFQHVPFEGLGSIQGWAESNSHSLTATRFYHETDFRHASAIIMGSEEDGVSGEYLKLSDELITIPMAGQIASLNVSVATGIVLFEVLKQRMI